MNNAKKVLLISAVIVAGLFNFAYHWTVRAQTVVAPITVESTQPHTACVLPPAGTSAYCFASDGLFVSINGAAYAQLNAAVAGVTSVSVNGGAAQTGAVALTIPTTASTTGTFTTTIH